MGDGGKCKRFAQGEKGSAVEETSQEKGQKPYLFHQVGGAVLITQCRRSNKKPRSWHEEKDQKKGRVQKYDEKNRVYTETSPRAHHERGLQKKADRADPDARGI